MSQNSKKSDSSFEDTFVPKKRKVNKNDKILQECPACKKKLRQVLQHIKRNKNCSEKCTKDQIESFKNDLRAQRRDWTQKYKEQKMKE